MFERGFKAWCERYSKEKRVELGVSPSDPLDPFNLAKQLGYNVWYPSDLDGLSLQSANVLAQANGGWSAVTIVVEEKTLIVLNATHSKGRQASDLMHEISHRVLDHKPHEMDVSADGVMLLSGYEKQQEEAADWLSGCLLLPRDALYSIKSRRIEDTEAAKAYGVSVSMMKYRMSMTGMNKQFRAG